MAYRDTHQLPFQMGMLTGKCLQKKLSIGKNELKNGAPTIGQLKPCLVQRNRLKIQERRVGAGVFPILKM